MANELAVKQSYQSQIQAAVERYNMTVEYVKTIMKEGKDFGAVPGTDKPTLLKPGAEKLSSLFNLYPVFRPTDKLLDWENGLFFYQYEASLVHRQTGEIWGTGLGSCNSRESKYQYRKGERACPTCGKAAIIKGKQEYGGGWICFAKKGGCGAKFKDGDQAIESQTTGRIINPDIPDLVNTIDKMAQKRALVAAALIACNASEFFTQDVEDMGFVGDYIPGEWRDVEPAQQKQAHAAPPMPVEPASPLTLSEAKEITNSDGEKYGDLPSDKLRGMRKSITQAIAKNHLEEAQKALYHRKLTAIELILEDRANQEAQPDNNNTDQN